MASPLPWCLGFVSQGCYRQRGTETILGLLKKNSLLLSRLEEVWPVSLIKETVFCAYELVSDAYRL